LPLTFMAGEIAFAGEIAGALESLPGVCASLYDRLRRRPDAVAAPAVAAGDAQVLAGVDAVREAAPAWRQIESMGGASTPFQSLALAQVAAETHFARGEIPHIAVVREAGRPVVILPTVVGRWGGLRTIRFLGDPLIQYGDALATPDARAQHLETAWQALSASAQANLIYLRKVRADANMAAFLAARASTVGLDEAPFVDIGRDAAHHARDARELRRFRRRLDEQGAVVFALHRGADALPLLREAMGLKRQWLKERDLASQVIGDPDWENTLAGMAANARDASPLAAASLTVGGRLAAVEIGLIQGERWYAFLGATHPDFARSGPGHVLMAETIAHCRANGLVTYDLLAPAQAYKRAMASGAVPVCDHAQALSLQGRFAMWAAGGIPVAKGALAALPAPVRRVLLRWTVRSTAAERNQ
jgi:CelD/BcsL family acetyltransferase involved in cellulose biosynthesis